MILLVDVGNTRIKWRYLELDQMYPGGQMVHRGDLTPDLLTQIWGGLETPDAIWCVCVAASRLREQISHWADKRWKLFPHFVTASKKQGRVINGYHEPEKLGADRWMALAGADRLMTGACCVVDCGTAVTIDCMDANHEHMGGIILPGLEMMPLCVSHNTAHVQFTEGAVGLLGQDTSSCLVSGATHAIIGTMQRILALAQMQLSSPVSGLVTGGDAQYLLPWLGKEWRYEEDLIFIGLVAAIQESEG